MKTTDNETTHILARLETGFRTDCARLEELEQELTVTLEGARHFGVKHGPPDRWNVTWQQHWDNIAGMLRRIRALVKEMDRFLQSGDSGQLEEALEAWGKIQPENAALVAALGAIRTQAIELDAAVRRDWNSVMHSLEPHLARLHACARALRIRVELLREPSGEGVEQIVRQLLSDLPRPGRTAESDAATRVQERRKAIVEIEQKKHEAGGLNEVFKGLLMWIETPEERARSNRSLKIDEVGDSPAAHHNEP